MIAGDGEYDGAGLSLVLVARRTGQPSMANLHDRQPIILDPAAYDAWLDPATPASAAKDLLRARSRWPTAIQQSRSAGEFEQE
ncbi:hypothetical protein EOA85_15850 [Mesorhizobium sp. M5C.F.Ca.IN.020.29.1.1]|uniref:SOS response-associated peptidase family protein n=2 Tax=unclassified Mesorhizobium TaxID=325217 RepID=UPI000FCC8502|nr:SOS response-associated peptidase family protein [Mesorhizobium sp. M5C.F.Ca.IN.020.29.1.1]RUV57521.1 hypothetical protein EOA85_15850 [Mesorhizobium sp. M5C.F.Ca.IN.020.29.1.1]TIM89707.1 MAG: SOS response-associated peptidase [Mesorhizobium sp.]